MQLTLIKFGNSVGLTIPRSLCEQLGLSAGQPVEARESGGRLIIAPKARRRYRLADMLAQCDPKAALPADLVAWEATAPVGNEVS